MWSFYLWQKEQAELAGKLPPTTAPVYPQPGRRFVIIKEEVGAANQGLMVNFDKPSSLRPTENALPNPLVDVQEPGGTDSPLSRKKKSIFSRVRDLALSNSKVGLEESLDQTRRDLAEARLRVSTGAPPPPPKQLTLASLFPNRAPSLSDTDSTNSSPVFDAATFVFKFVLSWPPGTPVNPPRERIVTTPRLPAPAQSWVYARDRSESAPVPCAGLPPPTRRVSGLASTGLVTEARNAHPLDEVTRHEPSSSRPSLALSMGSAPRESMTIGTAGSGRTSPSDSASPYPNDPSASFVTTETLVAPMRPHGPIGKSATYAGRALSEWNIVVNECNTFVERRREEGILGLSEVEVPNLGPEFVRNERLYRL